MTDIKQWEIDDAAVEELRKALPRYPSSLARAIASEAAHDFNDEHYASDAKYTLAQWFDAVLNRVSAAQPRLFTGCLRDGVCRGVCRNTDCPNYDLVVAARVCVEPKEAGIVYPKETT